MTRSRLNAPCGDVRQQLLDTVQLTTDGHRVYLETVEGAFGGNVHYAQLVKLFPT